MAGQRLFDAYLIVDWSANAKPKTGADSIWVALVGWQNGALRPFQLENCRTRHQARTLIRHLLGDLVQMQQRVLVGFDFPYGYPLGTATAWHLDGEAPAWRRTWRALCQRIQDEPDNANNRFATASDLNARTGGAPGPFWMCPAAAADAYLTVTKQRFPYPVAHGQLAEFRLTEQAMKRFGQPSSVWQLGGTGSVGSQALMGIPHLAALRDDPALRAVSLVWPFETGFALPVDQGAQIIHAEIWPGTAPLDFAAATIKDAAQVSGLATHFGSLDGAGELATLFGPPAGLEGDQLQSCLAEEGWVLGA